MERYVKQMLFAEIGREGQEKLLASRVVIIGCGALGTVIANNLARSGVGYIRIIDRDYIELSNLQRQILFDEEDLQNNLTKAAAAAQKLRKINSSIEIEEIIADVNPRNIEKFCQGMDLIMDATDNFNTRFLINDTSVKLRIPWIYGGAVSSMGMTHTIIPGETPCFRCIMPKVPPAGTADTCDLVGVLNGTVNVVASFQSVEAIKLLIGKKDALIKGSRYIDIWDNHYEILDHSIREDCPACQRKNFTYLQNNTEDAVYLCGQDSIQINPVNSSIDADNIIKRLETMGIRVLKNAFFLRFNIENVQFTLFHDGRAILKNTTDIAQAKSLYAKYIGL
ncbi:ThiF family adenylyltransferase [Geosporobacter ferrireducens]|nr:ThiF family adenylyltransferase [Geosporobacter ferrireducens]